MLRTTSYLVNDPVVPPGYAIVNGVLKGPSMEPSPGTGGSVPAPQGPGRSGPYAPPVSLNQLTLRKVTVVEDLATGHHHTTSALFNLDTAETGEERATAAMFKRMQPRAGISNRLQIGRPLEETQEQFAERTRAKLSPEQIEDIADAAAGDSPRGKE